MRGLIYGRLRGLQAEGIRRTKHCLNFMMDTTKASFEEIGKPFQRLAIPMVYNREDIGERAAPEKLRSALRQIESADLKIFCCARLMWVRNPMYSPQAWQSVSKNSDWLFRGLAQFVREHPGARPRLLVTDYGPDVEATKRLVAELGIEEHVVWLPKILRKEIMFLLAACDVGIGQFYRDPGIVSGTGWEILASGKPLLQSFNFAPEAFGAEFGYPPPPVLDAQSPADVAHHLAHMYANPENRKAIGQASLDWFNRYNGISLAARWLSLLSSEEGRAL